MKRDMTEIKTEINRLLEEDTRKGKLARLADKIGTQPPILYNTLQQTTRRIPATWIAPIAEFFKVSVRSILYKTKEK